MGQLKQTLLLFTGVLIFLFAFITAAQWRNPVGAQSAKPTATPDNSLSRVQEAGQLIVGTSLPYEPFEYRTGPFSLTLDGFDIALMKEIGQRMGVEVIFKDYAFDGLLGALMLQRLDAPAAAITITPDRANAVDFSQIYYQSAGAVLAKDDPTITTLDSLEDLVGQRIGFQRGTIYDTWVWQNLVITGLVPTSQIYTYGGLGPAVAEF